MSDVLTNSESDGGSGVGVDDALVTVVAPRRGNVILLLRWFGISCLALPPVSRKLFPGFWVPKVPLLVPPLRTRTGVLVVPPPP